jgi:hypothetical protein
MSTTLTPPPLPPVAGPPEPDPQQPGTRTSSKVIAILTMALGGALILGTIGTTVVSTVAAASIQTTGRSLAVDDVDALDVDLAAGTLVVEFADVTEAELEVTGSFGADQWTLRTDGGTLVVASPDWHFGTPWFFGNGNGRATLLLPSSLEGLDADFGLGAGDLTAEGEFGELELDLGAGRATLSGSAEVLTVDVSAGRADLDLADVRSAKLTVSAGSLVGTLTGDQPDAITLDVSAGSADLTVPEGDYDVSSDVSAGDLDNQIGSTPGASSTVRVDVSAGQAVLRAG